MLYYEVNEGEFFSFNLPLDLMYTSKLNLVNANQINQIVISFKFEDESVDWVQLDMSIPAIHGKTPYLNNS